MKYLISGGGTGGHIYPALAIANEIKYRHEDAEILYVGTENSLESELVPNEGFAFKTIRISGIPRKISFETIKAVNKIFLGLRDAKHIIKEFKPDVVIGTGGYVCGPVVYTASKMNIPTMIHEQNALPGITNKILSRYVDVVAATFEESLKCFKYPDKVGITGNPIRKDILTIDKSKAYSDLGINPKVPFILSFGGSGGQKKLNEAMYHVIKENIDNLNIQILHVTGKRFFDDFMNRIKNENIIIKNNISILPYLFEMPKSLNISDLVITSAGAITLSEISAVGVPSILIPKSYTAENHQVYNARSFEKKGASVVILEEDLNGQLLNEKINKLLGDSEKLMSMSTNTKRMSKPNVSEKIVDYIDELTKK